MNAIEIHALTKKFNGLTAVDNIELEIGEGELFGLLGPNGAGKTTTISMLSTILTPSSGNAKVWEKDIVKQRDDVRKTIGIVFQDPSLDDELTGKENLDFHGRLYGLDAKEREERINEVLKLVELEDRAKSLVKTYSGGMKRRLEIARGLMHKPKVLFLDEPTIGLDVVSQKKMRDFIKEYNRREKSTIILTSHYMGDVKELCQRVIIIDKGKLIFDGQLAEITEKYADHKIISAVLAKEIDPKKLEEIGKIKEYSFPKVVFLVRREAASVAAAELLQHFPVADLNIEEIPIEDIIREVFTGQNVA